MLNLVTLSILTDNSKAPLTISFDILCEYLYAFKETTYYQKDLYIIQS